MTAESLAMDRRTTRMLRFFLRLQYPRRIIATPEGFSGCFPDLPGCGCASAELSTLHVELEQRRRAWVAAALLAGREVPMPNSHTAAAAEPSALD